MVRVLLWDNSRVSFLSYGCKCRDSQKGIIIGKQGKALKKVATEARRELERFFGKTIFLETYVKVDKDWRSSDKELRNFGYQLD